MTDQSVSPIWTDNCGLTLRKTTSDDHYFLDVAENVRDAIQPFLELKETKAVYHPGRASLSPEGKSDALASDFPSDGPGPSEAKRWLLPVTLFPKINPFFEHFHDVLPSSGKDEKRDGKLAGLEWPAIERIVPLCII